MLPLEYRHMQNKSEPIRIWLPRIIMMSIRFVEIMIRIIIIIIIIRRRIELIMIIILMIIV